MTAFLFLKKQPTPVTTLLCSLSFLSLKILLWNYEVKMLEKYSSQLLKTSPSYCYFALSFALERTRNNS